MKIKEGVWVVVVVVVVLHVCVQYVLLVYPLIFLIKFSRISSRLGLPISCRLYCTRVFGLLICIILPKSIGVAMITESHSVFSMVAARSFICCSP